MFKHLTKTLTLDKTHVDFRYLDATPLDECLTLEEVMIPLQGEDSPFIPDFCVRGYFLPNIWSKPCFTISEDGPFILYITGRPKSEELPSSDRELFKLDGTHYQYYWEDNKIGYLTQIIRLPKHENY